MEKTGQSADGNVTFMEKFRYQELMSESRRDPYFRAHPISSDRVGTIAKRAEEITAKARPQTPEAIDELAMMKAKLVGFIGPPNRVLSRYPTTDQSLPAKYARAIAAYRAVDIKAALTQMDELIAEQPDNPYFHELKGQILFESGQVGGVGRAAPQVCRTGAAARLLKVNLARSLIGTKDDAAIKEAEGLLMDAIQLEPDNAFAWNQLADRLRQAGPDRRRRPRDGRGSLSCRRHAAGLQLRARARDKLDTQHAERPARGRHHGAVRPPQQSARQRAAASPGWRWTHQH